MKGIYWLGLLGIASFQALFLKPCFAQSSNIIPDNSLGAESSQVDENFSGLPLEVITGGAQRGINLFHSFQEFNVSEGRGAYFFSPNAEIQNILTRVTGRNPSEILGTLGTFGNSQPNLYLINPNGIVFGENASLDVGGSFVATTANGIEFGEQGSFSASNAQTPRLLNVSPSALFFNQVAAQPIVNKSRADAGRNPSNSFDTIGLRVPDGKSLLLVGGNVNMDSGKLNAYGGRVELGGLAAPGSINLLFEGDNLKLGFPENVTRADVSLTNNAFVRVEADAGGDIAINARNLDILQGSQLSTGIGRGLGTPDAVAGDILLNATGEIKVAGIGSNIFNNVRLGAEGNGGNITIDSASFLLQDGAQLITSTFGIGNAGNVQVTATETVSLADNAYILSTVQAGSDGQGGNIDINAATFSLTDGSQLQTIIRGASDTQSAGIGNAGNVNVKVSEAVDIAGRKNGFVSGIFSFVDTGTEGNGGNITIDSGSFSLRDGAGLAASTLGIGNAGNVQVSARDAVSLTGNAEILSTVEAGGDGQGGDIDIKAAKLSLTDGARLLTITSGASDTQSAGRGDAGNVNVKVTELIDITKSVISSFVGTGAEGNGGNITIDSGSLLLQDGAQLQASTYGIGDAGNVQVSARDAVSLAGNTYIFSTVEAGGVGQGGDIDINAANLTLQEGAQLQTITREASDTQPAGKGNAGNVNVKVNGLIDIVGEKNRFSSGILSYVGTGTEGDGGNISIDSGSFSLTDGARLQASTFGKGNAGNANVKVNGLVHIAGEKNGLYSRISSAVGTGAEGNGGNIIIDSGSFLLEDGARLRASTYGKGNAGNVKVTTTDTVSLARNALILSTVEAGGKGEGGDIDVNASTLTLQEGAQLLTLIRGTSYTDTQPAVGRGNAGNVNVRVSGLVDIAGENGLYSGIYSVADTGTVGNAGNITIDSGSFSLRDGALVNARTKTDDRGGDVTVNTSIFEALNGGQLIAITSGNGSAGKIIVNASEKTTISGSDP